MEINPSPETVAKGARFEAQDQLSFGIHLEDQTTQRNPSNISSRPSKMNPFDWHGPD